MRRKRFCAVTLVVGIAAGFLVVVNLNAPSAHSQTTKPEAAPVSSLEGFSIEDAVINVAGTTGKSVVSISAEVVRHAGAGKRFRFESPFGGESPFGEDEFFRRFFDDFSGGELPEQEFSQRGLGSGVIVDPEGYILTNDHVISGADKITVTLSDGKEFPGEIKGTDQRSDLTVIKINAHNLPAAQLGDSDNVKIGQWVVAIGNPFGFVMDNPEPTVTVGVISALHRSLGRMISRERDYSNLIQTDTAINPGNSGGPLVNLKGEVVGINVAIFSTSGGYQGIGFAIPINIAKNNLGKLIKGQKILYGWLGITVQELTDELVKYFGLPDKNGVLVARVLDKSPAQNAGIKESDVLKEFDGKPINNVKDLLRIVAASEVGRKVKVTVIRDKKSLALEVTVGERPQSQELEKATEETTAGTWRGLAVEGLTAANKRRFQIRENSGVVVVEVEPQSLADTAGIMRLEVILEINKQPIKELTDYQKITSPLKGDALVRTSRGYFVIKEK